MATTIIDELVTIFSYKNENKSLKKVEDSQKKIADNFSKLTKLAAGFFSAALIKGVASATDETGKFASSIGVATEELSALQFATERQGGSSDDASSGLQKLAESLGQVESGTGRAVKVFQDYGISAKRVDGSTKTSTELFTELNTRFQTLSKVQQFDLAKKLSLTPGFIKLLQTAPKEVAKLTKQASEFGAVISEEEAKASAEFNDALLDISKSFQKVARVIITAIAPAFRDFVSFISPIIASFDKTTLTTTALIVGILKIASVFKVLGAAASFLSLRMAPLLVWPAIFAGIFLVVQDLFTFLNGGDSVIGGFVDKILSFGESIKKFFAPILNIFENVKDFFKNIGGAVLDKFKDFFNFNSDVNVNPSGASTIVANTPANNSTNTSSTNTNTNNNNNSLNIGTVTVNTTKDSQNILDEITTSSQRFRIETGRKKEL